jgi:hypothetical protein
MAATRQPSIFFACANRFGDIVQQRGEENDFAFVRRQRAPVRAFQLRLANHARVNPDIAFAVIFRFLRARGQCAKPGEFRVEAGPVEAEMGRLRRKRKVHHSVPKTGATGILWVRKQL